MSGARSSPAHDYDQTVTSEFLEAATIKGAHTYIIALNYTLPKALPWIWPHAANRICADGGCNRLYDELPSMLPHEDPDALRCVRTEF